MPPDNINGVQTGSWLNFPFDQEIFIRRWEEVPDMVTHALLNSGAMVDDASITAELQAGGNLFTVPFENLLTGTPANYDGTVDIPVETLSGISISGMAWGRTQGWDLPGFVNDLTGHNHMNNMTPRTAKFWNDYRQRTLVAILQTLFEMTATNQESVDFVANHTLDTSAAIGVTDFNELAQMALGANRTAMSLIIAHSRVVKRLENLNLVDFNRYTVANAVPASWRIGYVGNHVLVESDEVPVSGTNYTTFMLGTGAIRRGRGRLTQPAVEIGRDPRSRGGVDSLYTRIREVMHPNGFDFRLPATVQTPSPREEDLRNPAFYTCLFDPKAIPIARLITDEAAV
jgi:hypothetical protein